MKAKTNLIFLIVLAAVIGVFCFCYSGCQRNAEQGKETTASAPDTPDVTSNIPATDTSENPADPVTLPGTEPNTDPADTDPATEPTTDTVSPGSDLPDTDSPVSDTPSDGPGSNIPSETPYGPVTYANQLPESDPVGDSYFADALFMGDSRTVGFQYSTASMTGAAYYAKVSLNIWQLNGTDDNGRFLTIDVNGESRTCNVMEAIALKPVFKKVYLCHGLSELGWDKSAFLKKYAEIIEQVKSLLPDAVIYLETIIPVTTERSNQNLFMVTNDRLWDYNAALAELAAQEGVYLINPAEIFTGADGALPAEYSWDGTHLVGDYNLDWYHYLKTHTAK